MIRHYEKLRIPDVNRKNSFEVEVNWNPRDKKTNECQYLRFTFPNGDKALVKRENFQAFLFAVGTPEQQRSLLAQSTKHVRWYETTVGVTAKKDIRKGEKIIFPIKITLPAFEQEAVSELGRAGVLKP